MKRFVLTCLLASSLLHLKSQSTYVGGVFPTLDHSGTINKHWSYGLYYFGAFPLTQLSGPKIANVANFLLFYSEQGITYSLTKQVSFNASYVYQRENALRTNFVNENRLHVQGTFKHKLGRVNLKHRLRLDNRFIKNNITEETPYTHRLRYLVGLDFPIKSKKNNLYFTAYQEAFFNTFNNSEKAYAENWAYAAIGFKLNEKNNLEAGPLYITWNTGNNKWFHQYYLQVTWISQLYFR